jgi:hypothetical protein
MASLIPRLRTAAPRVATTITTRYLSSSTILQRQPRVPDELGEGHVKGKTGGGEKLQSSADNASPKPKISNLSIPGVDAKEHMTEEQKKEVDEHNEEFEQKHDKGHKAGADKVDKNFWRRQ